jgi:hypothetical protein
LAIQRLLGGCCNCDCGDLPICDSQPCTLCLWRGCRRGRHTGHHCRCSCCCRSHKRLLACRMLLLRLLLLLLRLLEAF